VKFEFVWDSNSNPLSQTLTQTQVSKREEHLRAVGRFLPFLALLQPSPRPDRAQNQPTPQLPLTPLHPPTSGSRRSAAHLLSSLSLPCGPRTPTPFPFPYLSALTTPARARRPRRRSSRASPRGVARAAEPAGWRARQGRRERADPGATGEKGKDPAALIPQGSEAGRALAAATTWPEAAAGRGHGGLFPSKARGVDSKGGEGRRARANYPHWGFCPQSRAATGGGRRRGSRGRGGKAGSATRAAAGASLRSRTRGKGAVRVQGGSVVRG
jgi:hypothetical protein